MCSKHDLSASAALAAGCVAGFLFVVAASPAARAACSDFAGDATSAINGACITDTTVGAIDHESPSCGSSTAPDDIWTFTAPANGAMTVSANGLDYDEFLHVRSNCNSAPSEVGCDDDPGIATFDVLAGETYYIFVDGFLSNAGAYDLCLTLDAHEVAGECDDSIDNDNDGDLDCADADCVGLDGCPCSTDITGSVNGPTVSGSTVGAADSQTPSCNSTSTAGDHTYSFVAAGDGTVDISLTGPYDEVLHVRTACDGTGTEIACSDPGSASIAVTQGQTYYVVVDGWASGEGAYDLTLTMSEDDCGDGVDNDGDGNGDCLDPDCSGVGACPCVPTGDITSSINGPPVTGTTTGASDTATPSCNGTSTAGDHTYLVKAPGDGTLNVTLDGTNYDEVLHISTGCGGGGTELACSDPGSASIPVTAGQNYYVIVDGWSSSAGDYELTLTMSEDDCGDGLDNDGDGNSDCTDGDCSGIGGCPCVPQGDISGNINGAPVTGNTSGATDSLTPSCNSTGTAGDHIYSLTAPGNGTIDLTLTGAIDEVLHVVTDCAGTTELACSDPGTASIPVTTGQVLYVVVDGWGSSSGDYSLEIDMSEDDCADGIDNDGDGQADCGDGDCSGVGACPSFCAAPIVSTISCSTDFAADTQSGGSDVLSGYNNAPCGGCCDQPNDELVYEFMPQGSGSVTIRLDGMATDQDLYVMQGGCSPDPDCIAESDSASTVTDEVTFVATAGTTYYVVVENFSGGTGTFDLHVDAGGGACLEDCDDGIDNDNDGAIDCADSDCAGDPVCCGDGDGDGFANIACGGTDCNDLVNTIFPGAVETCNGIDDDCNNIIDDGQGGTWYADTDNDGFGDPNNAILACSVPAGYTADFTDCDDADGNVNPTAAELCNGTDDDCSPATPDGDDEPWLNAPCDGTDADLCEDGVSLCIAAAQLCTDSAASNAEVCNGLDDDCNGVPDDGIGTDWYADTDGDNFGDPNAVTVACTAPPNHVADWSDCNDGDSGVNPNALDSCNGVDDDCSPASADGSDEAWFGQLCDGLDLDLCIEGNLVCGPGFVQLCDDFTATDFDICDGLDNDCNGIVDDGGLTDWYPDNDGDGFGDPAGPIVPSCSPVADHVTNTLDCNDGDPNVNPNGSDMCNGVDDDCTATTLDGSAEPTLGNPCDGQDADLCEEGVIACSAGGLACTDLTGDLVEVCNDQDDDCDGAIDEGAQTDWFFDGDGDGYGDVNNTVAACAAPPGYIDIWGDCNDADSGVNPGATELCNNLDDDCSAASADGADEPWFGTSCDGADADLCEEGFIACDGSGPTCDDLSADTVEVCDGDDNDCDGQIDEDVALTWYLDSDGDGYGDPDKPMDTCAQPPNHVATPDDCNDGDASVNPGAKDLCNGADDDCQAATADGSGELWFGQACDSDDPDLCKSGALACINGSETCEEVAGDAPDICNGLDDDCDSEIDEDAACSAASGCDSARCIDGQCASEWACDVGQVCLDDGCADACDPTVDSTMCSEDGTTLLECFTDGSGNSGWIGTACGADQCAMNGETGEYTCCSPDCTGRECGTPTLCMVSCGVCDDGFTCPGPNEPYTVADDDPDAFSCVPGCASVASEVVGDPWWSVTPPQCGPALAGTVNMDVCELCAGGEACTDGVCAATCEEAQVPPSGQCGPGGVLQWCDGDATPQEETCADGFYCCEPGTTANASAEARCCDCALECELNGWECGFDSCGNACAAGVQTPDGCDTGFTCTEDHLCECADLTICGPDAAENESDAFGGLVVELDDDLGTGDPVTLSRDVTVSAGCSECSGAGGSGFDPGILFGLLGLVGLWIRRRRA